MKTVTDEFEKHYGEYEYNAFVMSMLRWFYGYDYKPAWCAVSMSYMMNQLGLLKQIGGKNQNCYEMLCAIKKAVKETGEGKVYERGDLKKGQVIKRGSIVFLLNDGKPPMHIKSKKHVTSVYEDFTWKGSGTWTSLGGNQRVTIKKGDEEITRDGIFKKNYTQARVYAIFEPNYTKHKTLRKGDKGPQVAELQSDLNFFGYRLAVDGSFGAKTEAAVKKFQTANSLKIDGIVGMKTWAMIDKLKSGVKRVTPTTLLYLRTEPNAKSEIKRVLQPGVFYYATLSQDEWYYFPDLDGWASSKYLKTV